MSEGDGDVHTDRAMRPIEISETPTLAKQIEAIEWALEHVDWINPTAKTLRAALEAAQETLECLQFMRETLR
jgi:hypothetical protein